MSLLKNQQSGGPLGDVLITSNTNAQAHALNCETIYTALGLGLLDGHVDHHVQRIKANKKVFCTL